MVMSNRKEGFICDLSGKEVYRGCIRNDTIPTLPGSLFEPGTLKRVI